MSDKNVPYAALAQGIADLEAFLTSLNSSVDDAISTFKSDLGAYAGQAANATAAATQSWKQAQSDCNNLLTNMKALVELISATNAQQDKTSAQAFAG
jgi:uncharacterized protein YukE